MTTETPEKNEAGCYLLYESDSSGKLMLYYSKTEVPGAIGFWEAGEGRTIQGFKFKKNMGRNELARGCAGGVNGRKLYYSGWTQYLKMAKLFDGTVTILPLHDVGLPVDLYGYHKDTLEVLKLEENVPFTVSDLDAVACLPKHSDVFEDCSKINKVLFLDKAQRVGASTTL
eukprot:CAMPEP_0172497666 /NCGR_PEP_ID=MMETSP1066-20121228/103077_1 /TAXON_ID=671091 /ORGANISM="Coscinodiscus wailesii, Strain CCMP2513" /LENGTH=170 /DNA_ID=CAMNT_0013270555 /DNA_START=95 /DNA_END=607 /DNA_ORIENTATION=+